MLNVIAGWNQLRSTSSRKRRKKRLINYDTRWRQLAFEELEDRRLLAVNFLNLANSLDSQLVSMQTRLTSGLNSYHSGTQSSIPLVGDSLGDASQIVSRFNSQLKSALSGLGTISNPSNSAIQNALASTTFLADRGVDGVGPEDVLITRPGDLGSEGFAVQMRLSATQTAAGTTISFDTGLPGLPVSVTANGTIDVSVGFAFELAFTFNSNTAQVSLDSMKTLAGLPAPDGNHPIVDPLNPLAIFVTAGLPANFSASATVGFVKGTATPIAGQGNALHVTAMVNNLTGTPTIKLDGNADANLRLTGSFAGTSNDFPGIDADFHLHWVFSSANPTGNAPEVVFDNVHMNLGKFISNVVGPVFEAIQTVTAPLDPVLKVLDYPLPGISGLSRLVGGNDVSLLDLGGVVAPYTDYGPLYDLFHNVVDLTNQINDFEIGATVRIPAGGFDLNTYDLRTITPAGNINNLNLPNLTNFTLTDANLRSLGQTFSQIVDNLDVSQDVKDTLHEFTAGLNNGFDIRFPILDRPQDAAFNLLLGRDTDLFELTAEAHIDASGSLVPSVSVFGMGVDFGGEVHVDTKFRFAYDTYGLRVLINNLAQGITSHIDSDILDGFYVASDSYFDMAGQIHAGVGASFAIFSATVGGFVSTDDEGEEPVSITIDDPNSDGKLRFAEFQTNPFETSGRFTAALGIEVRVGVKVFGKFIGWKKRFDIASTVIVDLNPPTPQDPPIPTGPILASQPDENGSVQLYIGETAHLRQEVDQENGSEKIIIRNIETTGDSETIEIALRQEFLGVEYWVTQEIAGVKSINGVGDVGDLVIDVLPGVNIDVDFEGGQGKAELRYNGAGEARLRAGEGDSYLVGGQGFNQLLGQDGDDTLVLGPGGSFVGGGLGDNTIIIGTPYADSGLIIGGTDPTAHNTIVVVSGENTAAINALPENPGSIALNFQLVGAPVSPNLILTNFSTFVVSAQDRATNVTIGDLSLAGVTEAIVNIPTVGDGGRLVTLDTKADGGPSQISVDPFMHTYFDDQDPPQEVIKNEITLSNTTTGMTTYLLGTRTNDVTTIRQHGGSAQIGQISHDEGTLLFDLSVRQPGTGEVVTMTTPALDPGNQISSYANGAGQFVIDAGNYPTLIFHGLAAIDSITMNVAAPGEAGGTNVVILEASTMHGALIVNALGSVTAVNDFTLSHASPDAAIAIHGGGTTSTLLLGTGQLARIKKNVTATNVELTINNSQAPLGSLLTLTASTFGNWIVPGLGVTPRLNFSSLRGQLEIFAGAGDRYQLDVTPAGITGLTMHNDTATLDPVYTANWVVPIALIGNFAFYAGQRLLTSGTVQRVKRLVNVGVPVTLNFNGVAPTKVVLDGDLDPPGAQYTIDGNGSLHVVNHTVGLSVTITGFRNADELYVYMPGATVAANLQRTSLGTIYLDGTARLAGTNPTAPNDITIQARYGQTEMTPLGQYISRLDMFNDVYLLGSMPQDDLTVNVPTNVRISMAEPTTFDIHPLAPGGISYSVAPARTDAVIAWKAGSRPNDGGSYWSFLIRNPSAAQWLHYFSVINGYQPPRFPNPFEMPYEISGFEDGPISVTEFRSTYEKISSNPDVYDYVVRGTEYSGTARYFLVDPNPVAVDNDVHLDASQLRGNFNFNITGPDYNYIGLLLNDSLYSLPRDIYWNNGATNEGDVGYETLMAFGQSDIVLSGAHPQLSVDITSQNRPFAYTTLYPDYFDPTRLNGDYPGTTVHVGDGSLANIQGQVSVDKVWLKDVDNRQGTQPDIVALTPTTLTWTGAAGGEATLTMGRLYGELFVTGSPYDRFAVEGTPNTAWKTTIQNFGTSQPPVGVYVMAKTVMPLEVTGNFELYVGQRLNADGTVTAVGQVRNVYNNQDKYHASSDPKFAPQPLYFERLFHNLKLVDRSFEFLSPTHIRYDVGYNDLYYGSEHKPLPVFYHYTGAGQGKLVFDAHDEQITGTSSDYSQFDSSIYFHHGISTNYLYPGKADLRFYKNSVIYGPNAEVFIYGPHITQGTNYFNPAPAMLLDNPFTTAVHYIANPNNTDPNLIEEVIIGNVHGPVYVEGSGRATRVEVNPLYSLPMGWNNNGMFESGYPYVFPGWGRGHTGGYSLIDTVHADVTVNNAALRVIADIPLPAGSPPVASRPNVTLTDSELVGIAGDTIHFSNLVNSISAAYGGLGQLDIDYAKYLPGLSIQLPAHAPVSTDVQDTPTGATTVISTMLSASDTAMTDGPITVRRTTGPLVLGQLFGPVYPGVDFHLYSSYYNVVQPVGSLQWGDGLSVPQVIIGDQGSLQNIHGPILLSGDSRQNSPLVTIIDGRNDPSRSNVSFTQPTYTQPPHSIVSWAFDSGLSKFQSQVAGLAPAPIYFGDFFRRPRALEIYGSAGSSYNITGSNSPIVIPPTTKLFTGANGSVTYNSGYVSPMSIIGPTSVQLNLAYSSSGGYILGYTGPPKIFVEQDPVHPQPIDLRVDRRTESLVTPGGTLRLDNAGSGTLSLGLNSEWRVLYNGANTHLAVNYGPINNGPFIVTDTGAAGTVISSGAASVDVYGTTGPLRIANPIGSSMSTTVRLGQDGNMQAILGDVEIVSPEAPLTVPPLALNNSADTTHRNIHLATDIDGNLRIAGMAPGLIKLIGERFTTTLTGGTGGSTWFVDSPLFPQTSNQITIAGGAIGDLLVGPNLPTTWTIDSTNSVRLGANVRVNNIRNLRGGASTDLFRSMNSSGTIAGDLDGGGGFNTLEYVSVPSPFVTDLVGGHAPRVEGTVTNIHAVIPEQLSFNAPTSRSDHDGDTISLQLTATSTVGGTLTYGASGLPGGLSIDPATGLLSGTLDVGNILTGTFQVTVTVSNGTNSRLRTIAWEVIGETPELPGDFNNDRTVDAADYVVWRKLGGTQTEYNTWRENFVHSLPPVTTTLPGDYNKDNVVDAADYVVWRKTGGSQAEYNAWRENFNRSLPPAGGILSGDYNHDNIADTADYVVWRKNGGTPAEYNTWRENFGNSRPFGAGAGSLPLSASNPPPTDQSSDTKLADTIETMIPRMSAVRPLPFELFLPRDNQVRATIRTTLVPPVAAASHDDGLLAWLVSPVDTQREIHDGYLEFKKLDSLADETREVQFASIDTALDELLASALE